MKYKRVLLKLSGEALMGSKKYGIDPVRLEQYTFILHANYFNGKYNTE
jgi:uridylate kinase